MITDTPDQYKEHMAAIAGQYLDVAKKIAKAASVTCDLVHLEHDQPYQAIIDTAAEIEAATRSIWPRMDDAGYPQFCLAARPSRPCRTAPSPSSCVVGRARRPSGIDLPRRKTVGRGARAAQQQVAVHYAAMAQQRVVSGPAVRFRRACLAFAVEVIKKDCLGAK